jgi:ATP-dependent RNA helicase RhlE
MNILAVGGLTAVVTPDAVPVAAAAIRFDMPVMIVVAVACLPIFFTGHVIMRWEGFVFVGYAVAYTAYLVLDAVGQWRWCQWRWPVDRRERWPQRGFAGQDGGAIVTGVREEEDHAPQPDCPLLQRDQPRRCLRVADARDRLDPDTMPGPLENCVDGAPVRRFCVDRDLGPPRPAGAEESVESGEEAQLSRVTQRGTARIGAHRDVQADRRAVPRQERRVDGSQLPVLHQADELARAAQDPRDPGHRDAPCQSGAPGVIENVIDLSSGTPAGGLDVVPSCTHAWSMAERGLRPRTDRLSQRGLAPAPAALAARRRTGRSNGRQPSDASVAGRRSEVTRLLRHCASQAGACRGSSACTVPNRSGRQSNWRQPPGIMPAPVRLASAAGTQRFFPPFRGATGGGASINRSMARRAVNAERNDWIEDRPGCASFAHRRRRGSRSRGAPRRVEGRRSRAWTAASRAVRGLHVPQRDSRSPWTHRRHEAQVCASNPWMHRSVMAAFSVGASSVHPIRVLRFRTRVRLALRSAPRLHPRPTSTNTIRPDRAPRPCVVGRALVRSFFLVTFHALGLRPTCFAPSSARATPIPPPSSARRSRSCSPAATCSPAPRPAPARPRPSCCRCSSSSPAGRRATVRIRALRVLAPTRELAIQVEESVRTYSGGRPARPPSTAASASAPRPARCAAAPRSWSPRPAACSTTRARDDRPARSRSSSSTRRTACSTWASSATSAGAGPAARPSPEPPVQRDLLREIRTLAEGLLDRPASVQVTPENTAVELVDQVVHPVDRERKRELLTHLVRTREIDQALVFTRTKHGANRLAEQLNRDGIAAAAIHGNKSQPQRVKRPRRLQGRPDPVPRRDRGRGARPGHRGAAARRELRAADGPGRLRPPHRPHRPCGCDRHAVSLVCIDEAPLLREIERLLQAPITSRVVPGFEPNRAIPAQPIRLRTGARHQPRAGAPRPGGGQRARGRFRAGRGQRRQRTFSSTR